MQARDRSSRILSALSAAFGGIFTCNANKTETTVGYGTLYGDLAGAFAATADLWKYQIYHLGRLLNDWYESPVIPEGIFTVKPSAELSEKQDVTKGMGDPLIYEYHDYLLKSFVEPWQRLCPEDLLTWYAEGSLEAHIGCHARVQDLFPTAKAFTEDLERWWGSLLRLLRRQAHPDPADPGHEPAPLRLRLKRVPGHAVLYGCVSCAEKELGV
mgnify:CR=1 FL=1